MTALLHSHYWPNIHYFIYVINSNRIVIDLHTHYQKQSYANRTEILSANGKLRLTLPVHKVKDHCPVIDVEISYTQRWQAVHWGAITSAYRNSPYFEFFEEDIKAFYQKQYRLLHEFNTDQLKLLLKLMRHKKDIGFTEQFPEDTTGTHDLRAMIHPKKRASEDTHACDALDKPYYQTFGHRYGFVPNLSVLDLLFNTGLEAVNHLKS